MMKAAENPISSLMEINPVMAFWSLPYIWAYTAMTSWLGAAARTDAVERNQDEGQIPVPPSHQDDFDKELFA